MNVDILDDLFRYGVQDVRTQFWGEILGFWDTILFPNFKHGQFVKYVP